MEINDLIHSARSEDANSLNRPLTANLSPIPLEPLENSEQVVADFITFEQFEEMQNASTRRRKIATGVALVVAAVVAPIASLLIAGKISLADLHRGKSAPQTVYQKVVPTPPHLSPAQRALRDKQVAIDLHNYAWNQLPPLIHEEQLAEKAFASVTDSHYKDDKTSYTTIRQVVVPHFQQFVTQASTIRPQTEPLRVVHRLMLTSARLKLMAYQEIAEGETDPDHLWRVGVRADFVESARRAALYHSDLIGLAKATHTKLP